MASEVNTSITNGVSRRASTASNNTLYDYDPNSSSNQINIANGEGSSQLSPDEEVIKARGRKEHIKLTRIKYEELPVVLATRKSPRKSSIDVDFSHFFRSPTPKKKTPIKRTSELDHIRIKSSIRKRLTLNSSSSETFKQSL